jgi:hypothetical protein
MYFYSFMHLYTWNKFFLNCVKMSGFIHQVVFWILLRKQTIRWVVEETNSNLGIHVHFSMLICSMAQSFLLGDRKYLQYIIVGILLYLSVPVIYLGYMFILAMYLSSSENPFLVICLRPVISWLLVFFCCGCTVLAMNALSILILDVNATVRWSDFEHKTATLIWIWILQFYWSKC